MKGTLKVRLAGLALLALCLSGCGTYHYRVVQPATAVPPIDNRPITIHYEPLDYRLSKDRDRLAVLITNPTADRIVLLGSKSFVVDPRGESHPIRDRIIGPHSYTRMLIPPVPFTYAYPDYWAYPPFGAWGYMGSWYDPMWGPWGAPYWGPPPMSYNHVLTIYDWKWKEGPARLRLTYEQCGKTFEHDFEFFRELAKRKH